MATDKRREEILTKLENRSEPIPGRKLAELFSVSRQVIVQDIALLRARGEKIQATSQGYCLEKSGNQMVEKTIACIHQQDEEDIAQELETIIEYGGRIKDVRVEHPLYGEIKGSLRIQSSEDIDDFIEEYIKKDVNPLLSLTNGIHLHTVEGFSQEVLESIEQKLKEKGFLVE